MTWRDLRRRLRHPSSGRREQCRSRLTDPGFVSARIPFILLRDSHGRGWAGRLSPGARFLANNEERTPSHRARQNGNAGEPAAAGKAASLGRLLIDPRLGDVEDDASSTKKRSMLSIAGSLLAEVSLPKLLVAWALMFAVPGVLFGVAPLVASAWLGVLSRTMRAEVGWTVF